MTATPFAPSAAGTDLSDLDLFVAGPPWAAFDSLRQGAPVHWNPEQAPNHGFWSITRHRDVVAVTRDEETFSSQVGATNLEELDAAQLDIRRSMLETDGARHFALRRLLQRDFSARALAPYETFLRGLTATTLDAALTKGGHGALPIDFVREVSADFPIRVLLRLLGVPDDHAGQLISWGNRMVGNTDPDEADVLLDSPTVSSTATCRSAPRLRWRCSPTVTSWLAGGAVGTVTTWSPSWSTGCRRTASRCPSRISTTTSCCWWWPEMRRRGTRSATR
jgi:cytochrome P450